MRHAKTDRDGRETASPDSRLRLLWVIPDERWSLPQW
jgi:hypothetical protein